MAAEAYEQSRTIEDPSDSATVGLENLQGAYLAQKDYNHGQHLTSLCLAIANLGTIATAINTLPQVLQRIIQFARYNSSFRGIVGFPMSSQASNALAILQSQQRTYIPIISPSATSNQLSDEENFYRVAPKDLRQGSAIAHFICTYYSRLLNDQELPVVDILSDSPDAYSSSLSQSFEKKIEKCPTNIPVYHDPYQTNDPTSIRAAADHAIAQHYPFIFFPGYFPDQDALEGEIQRMLLSRYDRSSSNVTIFSGDGLDELANTNHNTFATIYSTEYTFPLDNNTSTDTKFISEYENIQSSLPPLEHFIPSYTLLPLDAIDSYNAMIAFTSTLELLAARHIDPTQNNLNTYLSNVTFDGIEAHFSFHGDDKGSGNISDPEDIPLHLMCTDHTHTVHLVATYNTNDTLEMEQGKGLGLCS